MTATRSVAVDLGEERPRRRISDQLDHPTNNRPGDPDTDALELSRIDDLDFAIDLRCGDEIGDPESDVVETMVKIDSDGFESPRIWEGGVRLRVVLSPIATAHPGATRGVQALGGVLVDNKTNAIPCPLHILFRLLGGLDLPLSQEHR